MNNASRGAILSGLILPGLGQIILKHYVRGAVIMLVVFVSIAVAVVKAVQQALAVLGEIDITSGAIDINTILNATTQATTASAGLGFNLALLVAILCWAIGTVDAYRIGKKRDTEEASGPPAPGANGN